MNCEEFEREIEGFEDLSTLSPQVEVHRHACHACSTLLEDLTYIRAQARQLLIYDQPPDRIWNQIRKQLDESGTTAGPFHHVPAKPGFGWFPRLSMGMAYAAVFLIALGVVRVYTILSVPVALPPLPPAPNPPFATLFEKVPARERAVYVDNLQQVDSSIQELRTFLASHPEDPFARQELVTTYYQKSRLWEALVRWQEF